MSFKTKSVEGVGAWMKAEGFSDEVVQIFKGTIIIQLRYIASYVTVVFWDVS